MNFLPKNIKFLRSTFSVNQEQLALQVNKRLQTIGNWENKVSEPNVGELIIISNYFGITLDDLVLSDLSKSNLISEEHIQIFKEKGSLNGNRIGNPKGEKHPFLYEANYSSSTVQEGDESALWMVSQALKQIDTKLDGLRVLTESIASKGSLK